MNIPIVTTMQETLEQRLLSLCMTFKKFEDVNYPVTHIYTNMVKYLKEAGYSIDGLKKMKAPEFILAEEQIYRRLTEIYHAKKP